MFSYRKIVSIRTHSQKAKRSVGGRIYQGVYIYTIYTPWYVQRCCEAFTAPMQCSAAVATDVVQRLPGRPPARHEMVNSYGRVVVGTDWPILWELQRQRQKCTKAVGRPGSPGTAWGA